VYNKYYQEELAFLREMGAEFARAHPAAAPFLAERGADPDVERLLEGFAFLTGKLRLKLDDEFPELTQSLIRILYPHYLRPVPAMSILQFEPAPNMVKTAQRIPRGTAVDSVPVEEKACRFRTCSDVELLPMTVREASLERPAGAVAGLRLKVGFLPGAAADKPGPIRPRLFLHGDPATTCSLYLHLTRHLKEVIVRAPGAASGTRQLTLPPDAVRAVGFAEEDALIPYPTHAFPGYRVLQEYFTLPQKFLFLDIAGLEDLPGLQPLQEGFEILFPFLRQPDAALRVGADNVRLNCAPVVNLFECQSDPIRMDQRRVEYLVRPEAAKAQQAAVFSVNRAMGWEAGTAEPRELLDFASLGRGLGEKKGPGIVYFSTRLRPSILGAGVETYVSFVTESGESALPPTETVVLELTCTNRDLPQGLRVGDLCRPTSSTPTFARFRNITPVTPNLDPPLGPGLHWRLISNLSLNYLSLSSPEALRSLLGLYNFRALYDRQAEREHQLRLEAIRSVRAEPEERLHRGTPVRGTRIEIELAEANFAAEGEMVLFGDVLSEFLALYCSINSYTRLVVRGADKGEVYTWSPRSGRQTLI
jgi:type VI secretion system protein ImpG